MQLKDALTEGLKQHQIKGASSAMIMPDGRVHQIIAGCSHDTVSVDPDMLFAIGTITKNMVSALVLQLTEEGVLHLNDNLYKWLPRYPHVESTIRCFDSRKPIKSYAADV